MLSAPITALTRFCVRHPVSVVFLSLILAAWGVVAAIGHLGFKASRLDLINPNSGFNRLWLEYIEEFGEQDDLIIVVEGKSSAEIAPVLDELSEKISRFHHLFRSVLHGVDVSKIREKGLHYVPAEDLRKIAAFTQEAGNIARGQWEHLNIGFSLMQLQMRLMYPQEVMKQPVFVNSGLSEEQFRQMTLHELDLLSRSLMQAFDPKPTYGSPWPSMQQGQQGYAGMPDVVAACSQNETGYFIIPGSDGLDDKADSRTNAMGFALVQLVKNEKAEKSTRGSLVQNTEGIEKLRELIRETQENYPGLTIGLTGLPVMEHDEMQVSQDAMNKASLLAFLGVACVLFLGMGGFRYPVIANFVLLVGFSWTAGYILLSVGHLNILSVAFGAILIGLGTDFTVHYVARYMLLRQTVRSPAEAIVQTGSIVGPGVFTGAITTAAAFFMVGFAEFTGIVELGIICGGGLMLCCLSTMCMIPSLLQLTDGARPMRFVPTPINIDFWIKPLINRPLRTFLGSMVVTGFLLFGLSKVWYDHNLLNLQPDGLESVELEKKLLNIGGQNVWYALSIADDRDELLYRKSQFEKKYPELQITEIVSMIPGFDEAKRPYIGAIAQSLQGIPDQPPIIPPSRPEQIAESLMQLSAMLENDPFSQQIALQLKQAMQSLQRMSEADCYKRMQDYQYAVAGDLLNRLHSLRGMANPNPPDLTDLPAPFVSRFLSKNGKHLMRIYSSADIWNMDEMKEFVRKVRDIDPKATGSPLQTYEASLQMQKGFQQAPLYALLAIVFLLFFDFRSLRDTVMAMVPMFIGMVQTFGVLGLLGISLNPANMIAIPLIMGIGIDDGIHIIHDYRAQKGKRYRLNPSTAGAVLITSLTSIIGFGCMMIASHRGLQSLGRVLVIGMSCCLYCSVILLPAFLTWWTRNEAETEADTEVEETAQAAWEETLAGTTESHFDRIHGIQATDPLPVSGEEEYDSSVFPFYSGERTTEENSDGTTSTKTKRLKRRSVA